MKKKIIFGGLMGLVLLAGTMTTVYARGGWGGKTLSEEEKTEMEEKRAEMEQKRTEMEEIFANNDYETWESLMQERVLEMQKRVDEFKAQINEDNFKKMTEIRKLMTEGKHEEARELSQGLGEMGFGMGCGVGRGRRGDRGLGMGPMMPLMTKP